MNELPRSVQESARILVVDADAAQRATVLALMRDAGHDAHEATTGDEAIALAGRMRPDLVLLDTGITGLDPDALVQRLRGDPALDHALVVQLGPRPRALADPAGAADAVLARRLPRRELLARVEAMLRMQRAENALRRLKRRQATRLEVTRVLSSARSLDEAGPRLLRALAEGGGWALGELWMTKPGVGRMRRVAAWCDPAAGVEDFVRDPAEPWVAPGEDVVGEAWRSGELGWLADVHTRSDFDRAAGARRCGLRGAAVVPVSSGHGVEAVLVLLGRENPPADPDLVLMLSDIGTQFGHLLHRVEAETELRLQRDLFHAMIESIPDGVMLKDLDGRYLIVNQPLARVLGRPAAELIGRCDRDVLRPELLERIRAQEEEAMRNGVSATSEYEVGPPEEPRRLLMLKSVCRDADGRILGTIGVAHDITEHRNAEERMRLAQRVEALGRLAGGVAHDFNNLLTVITVNSDLALQRIEPEHPLATAFVEIRDAAERASELTRQLLAYGRRQHLHPRTLDLNAVLANLESLLRRLIPENIVIVIEPGPALDPVTIDPTQIEQVVLNLAVNARDAMPHGGHLTIETRTEVVVEGGSAHRPPMPPGRYTVLRVADDGLGMDETTRGRIFEPFFTTKSLGQGTGLGLAMVYGTVKQSGGWIWVDSAPDQGTTFTLYLPAATTPIEPARAAPAPRAAPRGTETVLLVEDDAVVRDISRRVLEGSGYRVLVARDGPQAIELACGTADAIALVVTDVVMPRMSGPELAERLHALRPGLRVLFVSGYADQAVLPEAVMAGGLPFLQKPFKPETLARVVRDTLDGPPQA